MVLHPFHLIFFFFLIMSINFTASLNNWLVIWLSLEFNTLVFIPLLLMKKSKMSSESAMKYFIVQALASVVILMMIIASMTYNMDVTMLIPLMLKMGAAPLHQWVPLLSEGLSWGQMWILLTVQKVNPLILLSSVKLSDLLFMFILSSAILGSFMGLSQYSLRKLMVYSAIANISWMLSSCLVSNVLLTIYFMVYSFIVLLLFLMFKCSNMNSISQMTAGGKMNCYSISIGLLSLGGLPPFSGFVPKMVIILELLKMGMGGLVSILMVTTFLSLFFYMRMLLMSLFYSASKFVISFSPKTGWITMLINTLINVVPTPFMTFM